VSFLVERLADLKQHVDHLRGLRPRVTSPAQLERDLSLHNDVLFSLLVACQAVIDIAGELAARRAIRFQDYTEAIRALHQLGGFPPELVEKLVRLPGFRNVVIHEYVSLDYSRVLEALEDLDTLERFQKIVAEMEERDQR
jgi:uncharacterized protein YutE (UPF0331/DUF86 family)